MDYSLSGSSIHGFFQARILEWVAISFSRRSSQPRDWTWVSHIVGFTIWARSRDQIANIHWIIEKAREFQKNIYFCFIDYGKAFDYVDHKKLWKILKEMGIPEHFIFLLRNLYASQEVTVKTWHGTTDWFKIGKGVQQSYLLSSCLFNLHAKYIMWNTWLDESQTEIKIAGRNISNLRYTDDTTLI